MGDQFEYVKYEILISFDRIIAATDLEVPGFSEKSPGFICDQTKENTH